MDNVGVFHSENDDRHYRLIPFSTGRDYIDTDSFEFTNNTFTSTPSIAVEWDDYNWSSNTAKFRQGFTMKKPGRLQYDLEFTLDITAGNEIPSWNSARIWLQRGTDVPVPKNSGLKARFLLQIRRTPIR